MRSLFFFAATCLICSAIVPNASGQQKPTVTSQKDDRTQQEIRDLREQIETMQATQRQILEELKELRKLLESRSAEAAAINNLPQVISINVHGEPFKGSTDAQLAIVEYSDFECPYCGKYARETYPRIVSEYIKTGKIRYYFRDLPLPIHPNAMLAAQSARCAGDQGKFWEMHDSLFANQTALGSKDLTDRTHTIGIDQAKFQECITSEKYALAIRRSASGAEQMGINGTPAFGLGVVASNGDVINVSQFVLGFQSYDDLKQVLDDMLSSQGKKSAGR